MLNQITKTFAQDIDQDVTSLLHDVGGTEAELTTIMDYINTVIAVAVNLAGIVALLMVFYATILYVTSYGDDTKIETAKKTLHWSIIGLVFVAFAKLMVYIFRDSIN